MKHPRARPIAAARVVLSLYTDHVHRFGEGRECGCEKGSPDQSCDRGEALWRMQIKELLPFNDGRRGP